MAAAALCPTPHRRRAMIRRAGAAFLLACLVGGCGSGPAASGRPSAPEATPSAATPSAVTRASPSAGSPVASSPASVDSPSASPAAASASPLVSASPSAATADWPVYGGDAIRSGVNAAFPAPASPTIAWRATLDGAVYAQPLVVGGRVIAATEGDSVYALDPATGTVLWRRHLGTPVPLSTLPCGNIDPLGITGTPAYDPASGSLFVVAEVRGPHHVLFALDPVSGAVRWSRDIDPAGRDPRTHQQRPALAVGNGYVYIGLGGLAGDCGQYKGTVVGVPTSGSGPTITYVVPVRREGAVWATGGPVLDAAGHLYVSTGNGSSTTTYDGSDSVLELSASLRLLSRFAPSTWAADNARDADLGSLSPVLLPDGWVFIAGKSGTGYVLRQGDLGGIGGQVSSARVCRGFGAAAHTGSTVFVPCSDGIRQVTIDGSGAIHVGWHTSSGATGPPAVGDGAVWSVDIGAGFLYALRPTNGAVIARVPVGPVPHFAAPSLWHGLVLVGTMRGVTAVQAAP